jgi:hypothetical protein
LIFQYMSQSVVRCNGPLVSENGLSHPRARLRECCRKRVFESKSPCPHPAVLKHGRARRACSKLKERKLRRMQGGMVQGAGSGKAGFGFPRFFVNLHRHVNQSESVRHLCAKTMHFVQGCSLPLPCAVVREKNSRVILQS